MEERGNVIIGVDAAALSESNPQNRTGVYYYALNILKALSCLDRENLYYLYGYNDPDKEIKSFFGKNFCFKTIKPVRFWHSLRLPLQIVKDKPDMFLGLSQTLPIAHPKHSIAVIHDLAFEFYPKYYPDAKRLSSKTRYAVKSAERLIAVSKSTKNDLMSLYGEDKEKIKVVYHGVDQIFKSASNREKDRIRKIYGIKGEYFLFAGKAREIKNIHRLLKAFSIFNSGTGNRYSLCLAGDSSGVKTGGMAEIRKLGYVPFADLPALYSDAVGLLSPSLYEGFGMTVLEALSCGCPVMVSDRGSFDELAKNIKITVDPEKIESIAHGIELLLRINRKKFSTVAEEYSRSFTWQESATMMLELFDNII